MGGLALAQGLAAARRVVAVGAGRTQPVASAAPAPAAPAPARLGPLVREALVRPVRAGAAEASLVAVGAAPASLAAVAEAVEGVGPARPRPSSSTARIWAMGRSCS